MKTDQLKLLRRGEVMRRTGLGETSLYLRVRSGLFPAGIPLHAGSNSPLAWLEHEVSALIAATVIKLPDVQVRALVLRLEMAREPTARRFLDE